MPRIPAVTLESAPDAARPMLEEVRAGSGGRLLNLHLELANAPSVLAAYVGIRQATSRYGALDARTRTALMLAAAGAGGSAYSEAITSQLAPTGGWSAEQASAIRAGSFAEDRKLAALLAVVREATVSRGHVTEPTWRSAVDAGWTDGELADAFASVGLIVYVDYFNHYAGTELDLPL